ncbi:MAG: type III-B CRISPR-associated protein Cas10/Cmr2 [Chloroflexota bacterium]|nr:type III-B CRISPR-associated protein Cas10/Cmr2 [Chloroflexota bacterium]
MTQPALMLFGLGPVQDFIASARTTRDLLTGSTILAHLAEEAHAAACKQPGVQPYYPIPKAETDGFPNKFSLMLDDEKQAKTVAGVAQNAALKEWKRIADGVRRHLQTRMALQSGWDELWDVQIDNLLEFYWACVPVASSEDKKVREAQEQANILLDARKRLRDFKPYLGDQREKDTIDGALEQMGPVTGDNRLFWKELQERLDSSGSFVRLSPNERLSAVNLTKRFAFHVFPALVPDTTSHIRSTSDIATAYWKDHLQKLVGENSEVRKAWEEYRQALEPFLQAIKEPGGRIDKVDDVDGSFFYVEGLEPSEAQLENLNSKEIKTKARQAQDKLKALLKLTDLPSPSRYYSVLFLDGDKMGEVVSGKRTKKGQEARHPKEISADLEKYTSEVRRIVKEHIGLVIYTGGDDGLILLPNQTALACALELQRAWKLPETSVSMGLVVAHHKHPLRRVLEAGRAAEHTAKDEFDRDALAIQILKRSGETLQAGSNWKQHDTDNQLLEVFKILEDLRNYFQREWLSLKMPYRLRQEVQLIIPDQEDEDTEDSKKLKEMLGAEFKRIYKRQSNTPDAEPEAKEKVGILGDQLFKLAKIGNFDNFTNLLLVSAFLARSSDER